MNNISDRTFPVGFASGLLPAEGGRRRCVLTINGGSSSLKFAVFEVDPIARVFSGRVERVGLAGSRLIVADADRGGGRTFGSMPPIRRRPPGW